MKNLTLMISVLISGNIICTGSPSQENIEQERNRELISAVSVNDINKVRNLIENGADINGLYKKSGFTPLMMAAHRGNKEIVEFLLNQKIIDVNKIDEDGDKNTALMYAVLAGHPDIVRLLLHKKADKTKNNLWVLSPCKVAIDSLETAILNKKIEEVEKYTHISRLLGCRESQD